MWLWICPNSLIEYRTEIRSILLIKLVNLITSNHQ